MLSENKYKYLLIVFLPFLFCSCVIISTHVKSFDFKNIKSNTSIIPDYIVKADLKGGALIVFEKGCTITKDSVMGIGKKYSFAGIFENDISSVSCDSIDNIRYYKRKWEYFMTLSSIPIVSIFVLFLMILIQVIFFGPIRMG